jgi:hypothetical protein
MAKDARRSEELDGNFMKNNSSSRDVGRGVGFEPHLLRLLYVRANGSQDWSELEQNPREFE